MDEDPEAILYRAIAAKSDDFPDVVNRMIDTSENTKLRNYMFTSPVIKKFDDPGMGHHGAECLFTAETSYLY